MEVGFEWHLYPAMLLVTILILSAIAIIAESLPWGRTGRFVGGALLGLIAVGFLLRTVDYARNHERGFWLGARDAVYRDIAAYLVAHAEADDVVVASEVGTIAYYSELQMLDTLQLATPSAGEAARRLKPRLRWFIDIPAYTGKPLAHAVHVARSEPLHPGEPFPPGRNRFTASIVPWSMLP